MDYDDDIDFKELLEDEIDRGNLDFSHALRYAIRYKLGLTMDEIREILHDVPVRTLSDGETRLYSIYDIHASIEAKINMGVKMMDLEFFLDNVKTPLAELPRAKVYHKKEKQKAIPLPKKKILPAPDKKLINVNGAINYAMDKLKISRSNAYDKLDDLPRLWENGNSKYIGLDALEARVKELMKDNGSSAPKGYLDRVQAVEEFERLGVKGWMIPKIIAKIPSINRLDERHKRKKFYKKEDIKL